MRDYILAEKEGERMALRVESGTPNRGVLILLDREEKSGPFFITPKRKYPIVSLRQPPELCGVDESAFDPAQKEKLVATYRDSFCRSLARAVEQSGITTLLIAGGGVPWSQSTYAQHFPGLDVEEVLSDIKVF